MIDKTVFTGDYMAQRDLMLDGQTSLVVVFMACVLERREMC